jgi:hypothetical protein
VYRRQAKSDGNSTRFVERVRWAVAVVLKHLIAKLGRGTKTAMEIMDKKESIFDWNLGKLDLFSAKLK